MMDCNPEVEATQTLPSPKLLLVRVLYHRNRTETKRHSPGNGKNSRKLGRKRKAEL